MTRTSDKYYADVPHEGGWLWISAAQLGHISSATAGVLTRNAQGDWSLSRTAGAAETLRFVAGFTINLRRLIEAYDFQEQFGGAQGPIPLEGRPPFTGSSHLVPPTAAPAKGIRIDDVVAVYRVGVAALTSAALTLDQVGYADVTAPAVTAMPIAATALPLTTDADPHLVNRAVTTPAEVVLDNSDIILELEAVMANTGTLDVYGLGVHCGFNYN